MINHKFVFLLYISLFQKNDITKFLWGRLDGIAPTTFGRGGDRPHRPHRVGAYVAGRQRHRTRQQTLRSVTYLTAKGAKFSAEKRLDDSLHERKNVCKFCMMTIEERCFTRNYTHRPTYIRTYMLVVHWLQLYSAFCLCFCLENSASVSSSASSNALTATLQLYNRSCAVQS